MDQTTLAVITAQRPVVGTPLPSSQGIFFKPKSRRSGYKSKSKKGDPFVYLDGYTKVVAISTNPRANCRVHLCRRDERSDLFAAKATRDPFKRDIERLENEYKILHDLVHPNIVRVVELVRVVVGPIMVMEYIRSQRLSDWLVSRKHVSEKAGRLIASNLSHAVDYLVKKGVAHRNISPENILLQGFASESTEGSAVLIGFGKAQKMQKSTASTEDFFSVESVAPDSGIRSSLHRLTVDCRAPDFAADVWGIGTTTAAVLTRHTFDEIYDLSRICVVHKQRFLYSGSPWVFELSEIMPSAYAADFVATACTLSPLQRPTISFLLQHPFLDTDGSA
jgi:serine/threonine protein kinase